MLLWLLVGGAGGLVLGAFVPKLASWVKSKLSSAAADVKKL